jgi:hypothetical protein
MSDTFTQPVRAGEFIVSEANGSRSRAAVVIASGADLVAGTVLGRTTGGTATATAKAGNTGNGVMGAVTVGAGAKDGNYTLTITAAAANAGAFEVRDPDGELVGEGNVAQAFNHGGLSFTLADGATDFAVGDGFTIAVALGADTYKALNTAGTDGSQHAAAVLYGPANAASASVNATAIVRDAEVNGNVLTWPNGISDADKAAAVAALAEAGIIVRS